MPNTVNKALNTPNTGDLSGAWGTTAVNNNMTVIDGLFGGVQSVSLTNANVSLSISTGSIGTGSITAGAGPVQSDNAVLRFIGTLTGNCDITFPAPGFWIVENNCTVGAFYVRARAAGTGNLIGLPPGEPCHIYNDGTDCKYVNMGRVGEFLDLCVATTPSWMNAGTVPPYLPCVGTATYSFTTYPALGAMLGSTFGGNGITTFGVPDLANRARVSIDTAGAGRLTFAGSNITGTLFGASGGSQALSAHTHTATTGTESATHAHTYAARTGVSLSGGGADTVPSGGPSTTTSSTETATHTHAVSISTSGLGGAGNVQPSMIFGVTFIKT